MRVRVSYAVDVDDRYRRAITHSWGYHDRPATRLEIQSYLERVGAANDDDLLQEYDDCTEGCHPETTNE